MRWLSRDSIALENFLLALLTRWTVVLEDVFRGSRLEGFRPAIFGGHVVECWRGL